VERGRSGRLVRLELVGENGRRVIGKELEIRRALSSSHLYSSAFVVEIEGPAERPDAFLLRGAGWGHGVGLCQIGAAVMASRGFGYREILRHYYPGAEVERLYE
jgi:SpoIID/LytB domain protein